MARLVSTDTFKALKMQVLRVAVHWASRAELDSKLTLAFPATSHAYLFTTPKPHMGADITKKLGLHLYQKKPSLLVNVSQKSSVDQLKSDISKYN